MTDAQAWFIIIAVFAIQPVLWWMLCRIDRATIDSRLRTMTAKIETLSTRLDNLAPREDAR